MPKRKYGWRPQKPDHRDLMFSAHNVGNLPPRADLRGPNMPAPYDQGELGSCTGNSIAPAIEFERNKQGLAAPGSITTPSRLMIYYLERMIEGTVPWDAGAEIRDGIKAVASTGTCFEDLWPYDEAKFTEQPPQYCFEAAKTDRAVQYMAVPQIAQQLRGCLAAGYPFVFGFTCYEDLDSDEVAQSGILPMPGPGDAPAGGHAVLAVGYDDASRHFLIRNSWGPDWGQGGYFWMPYEYVQRPDLSSDFWTIRLIA